MQSLSGEDNIIGTVAEQSSYSVIATVKANKDVAFSASDGGTLGMKETMITNIMKYYDVPPMCWSNIVLIDDQM